MRSLFFRGLLSRLSRKSHCSGVLGLVARCWLFNPEGSCSNPCVCTIFSSRIFQSKKISHFFDTMRRPPFNLFHILQETNVKKTQRPSSLLTVFSIVRVFKKYSLCLEIRFSQAHTLYPIFVFSKTGVFSMLLLIKKCYLRSPFQFLLEAKRFASIKTTQGFRHYATYRRPSKKFSKYFDFFLFFSMFSVEKDRFFGVSSWGRIVFEPYAYPSGIF